MRNSGFRWIIMVIMVLLDFYVFQAIKVVSQGAPPKIRITIYALYWTISIVAILLLALLPYISYEVWPRSVRTYLFATIVGLFFAKVIAATSLFLWIGVMYMGRMLPYIGNSF